MHGGLGWLDGKAARCAVRLPRCPARTFLTFIASMGSPTDDRRVGRSHLLTGGVLVAALLATAAFLLSAGVPEAWIVLGLCGLTTVPVVAWFVVRGRVFEPLPLLMGACVLLFVVRPLQLFLEWRDLYSYFFPADPVGRLTYLEAQEVALYVDERLSEPLGTALTRGLVACCVFLLLMLLGYRLGLAEPIANRLSRMRSTAPPFNTAAAIVISLVVGTAAQLAIVLRAGGPASSLEKASDQVALADRFFLFFLAGFAIAALIVWAAWRPPKRRVEWCGFLLSVVGVCAFSVLTGSRTRAFLALVIVAVIVHYLWRPWRRRELAIGLLVLLAFASSLLVFRGVADTGTLSDAATQAGHNALNPRVILNDLTSFDHVLYATTIYGRSRSHERGAFLLNGARSFLPGAIDPGKPEGGDIAFRKVVWKDEFGAGRPPTAVGDLYIDFGFPGIAVGAVLIGILARALLALLAEGRGREYRIALFAISLAVLYEIVTSTFSIAFGDALTLGLPFLIAVHLFGRVSTRRHEVTGPSAT